jgi:AraC-like DNA-binding protein
MVMFMVEEIEGKSTVTAGEEELSPELEEKLPFPSARIVRILKENLSKPHQIRAEVKVALNEFLGAVLEDVAREMDKEEIFTLNLEHFNKAVRKYKMIEFQQKRIDRVKKLLEKQRAEIDEIISEIDLTREL